MTTTSKHLERAQQLIRSPLKSSNPQTRRLAALKLVQPDKRNPEVSVPTRKGERLIAYPAGGGEADFRSIMMRALKMVASTPQGVAFLRKLAKEAMTLSPSREKAVANATHAFSEAFANKLGAFPLEREKMRIIRSRERTADLLQQRLMDKGLGKA